jgi:hypothetical protein
MTGKISFDGASGKMQRRQVSSDWMNESRPSMPQMLALPALHFPRGAAKEGLSRHRCDAGGHRLAPGVRDD